MKNVKKLPTSKKLEIAKKAGGKEVKTAKEIPVKEAPIKEEEILSKSDIQLIYNFCEKQGITPTDLVKGYNPLKNRFKGKQEPKEAQTEPVLARNRKMVEPEEGTNAYFIRYGAYFKKDIPKEKK